MRVETALPWDRVIHSLGTMLEPILRIGHISG